MKNNKMKNEDRDNRHKFDAVTEMATSKRLKVPTLQPPNPGLSENGRSVNFQWRRNARNSAHLHPDPANSTITWAFVLNW
jgi:hypothetical protein